MSNAWLKDLEERVHQACEQLSDLRAENAELNEKLAASTDRQTELEGQNTELTTALEEARAQIEQQSTELTEAKAEAQAAEKARGEAESSPDPDAVAWQAEREDVRTRVSSLVDHLASLLEDESSGE